MNESEKIVRVAIGPHPTIHAHKSLSDPTHVKAVAAPVRNAIPHFFRHRVRAHRIVGFVDHDAHRPDKLNAPPTSLEKVWKIRVIPLFAILRRRLRFVEHAEIVFGYALVESAQVFDNDVRGHAPVLYIGLCHRVVNGDAWSRAHELGDAGRLA